MKTFLKNMFFLIQVGVVVFFESICYLYYGNFDYFVDGLTSSLVRVNVLYVKMFQAIAFNNGFISGALNEKIVKYTDSVPWNDSEIDLSTLLQIQDEFNVVIDTTSTKGGIIPVNSGMISLVFHAYSRNSQNLVVKIKRKNIEKTINESIERLVFFVYILSFIPVVKRYRISEIIERNLNLIRQQLNFNDEVTNMCRMKENCVNLDYIQIPAVERNITIKYPNVIVMERLYGDKIGKVEEKDQLEFAKQVVRFGAVTTIIHGLTHGDLHPGNILFIKDPLDSSYKHKIGIIDFGIVYEIDKAFQEKMVDLYSNLFIRTHEEVASSILYSGCLEPVDVIAQLPKVHSDNLIRIMSEILDKVMNHSAANELEVCNVLINIDSYLRNNNLFELGIRPSNNFVKAQLALAMSQGVTLTLCKEKFISVVEMVVNEVFHSELHECL
jgi:predicted unusual protein kinase regulating ubiquinone biosynthesis (AarF/ABC1/UbiB family)